MRKTLFAVTVAIAASAFAASADARTYIFAASVLGHPYWTAAYQGFDYAAQKFGVEIKRAGPQVGTRPRMLAALRNPSPSTPMASLPFSGTPVQFLR